MLSTLTFFILLFCRVLVQRFALRPLPHSALQWKAPLCLKPYEGVCLPAQFRLNDFQHTQSYKSAPPINIHQISTLAHIK